MNAPGLYSALTQRCFGYIASALMFIALAASALPCSSAEVGNAYYLFISRYPDLATPSWGENDAITQGVGHGSQNWYFTATGASGPLESPDWIIWRIPISEPLDQDFSGCSSPGVCFARRSQYHDLDLELGLEHPGDLDCQVHGNRDYLFVPMRNSSGPWIVVFTGDDFHLVDYQSLSAQRDVGWCAVRADTLFSSNDDADAVFTYHIDWSSLESGPPSHKFLSRGPQYQLHNINSEGAQYSTIYNMQGGEFSEDGHRLYISSGILEVPFKTRQYPTDGLHVFDTMTWSEVRTATNAERQNADYFNFSFDNSFSGGDEPEGLTIANLDGGQAPFVEGQLHVLVYNHNYVQVPGNSSTVTLMHYTGNLNVDGLNGTPLTAVPPPTGGVDRPFLTPADAIGRYPAWEGAQVVIRPWSYKGPTTLGSGVRGTISVVSPNGVASFGGTAPVFGVQLFEHPNYQGSSRFFIGNVPDLDLGTINFADVASSVRVYGTSAVRLYDSSHYVGGYLTVTSDIPDLNVLDWNDRVGSIRINPH